MAHGGGGHGKRRSVNWEIHTQKSQSPKTPQKEKKRNSCKHCVLAQGRVVGGKNVTGKGQEKWGKKAKLLYLKTIVPVHAESQETSLR